MDKTDGFSIVVFEEDKEKSSMDLSAYDAQSGILGSCWIPRTYFQSESLPFFLLLCPLAYTYMVRVTRNYESRIIKQRMRSFTYRNDHFL